MQRENWLVLSVLEYRNYSRATLWHGPYFVGLILRSYNHLCLAFSVLQWRTVLRAIVMVGFDVFRVFRLPCIAHSMHRYAAQAQTRLQSDASVLLCRLEIFP